MGRFFIALAAILISLGGEGMARGAVILSFTSGSPAVTTAPGGTFVFDVALVIDGPEQVLGFDYYLRGSGLFYASDFLLLDRASDLAFFPGLNTTDATVVSPEADAWLSPQNARSLGATVAGLTPVSGTGSYRLATFTVVVSPSAALGDYAIDAVLSSWVDQAFVEQAFDAPGHLIVNVVPEPGILGLGFAAAFVLLPRRRR